VTVASSPETTAESVSPEFIRRAVELADLDAVRVALFHHTDDPEIEALPRMLELDDDQRELLITKATAWLMENAGPGMPDEPPMPRLRQLMDFATKEEMGDLEFESRRELMAFKPFPWTVDWTDAKPEIPEGFQVAIIGSGFSGLAAGIQMELLGLPYVILERRSEPGGTWSRHRYPDIRVDTISITYEFAFEKNYPWPEYFGKGQYVREYLLHISRKYGMYDNTRFDHDLKRATFDENRDVWVLEADTPNGIETIEANVVINAVGAFANQRTPNFKGLEDFPGPIIHPSQWPEDYDYKDRRIAVIGNGSTGVQLLSPIAEEAEQVYVFQRSKQWISPRPKYGQPIEPEVRWLLDNFPGYWNWWRYMAIAALFKTHDQLVPDEEWQANGGYWNEVNDQLRSFLTNYIHEQTDNDPDLVDRLIPDYAPFSRRPVVDNGWYRALTRDNVELITDPIARFTPDGIETEDGTLHEVDTVITAIGFEIVQFLWPADYIGRDGLNVHDFWSKDGPRAYISMMVPHFPNMFMLYGPNSQPLSGGTGLPIWYQVWSGYAAQLIVRMLEEGKSSVEVKLEAHERYNEALDKEASKLLLMHDMGSPDNNYYVNSTHNRLQMSSPWYGPEYHRLCTEVDWDDIEIT